MPEPGEDIAPDSVQPVVLLNEDGERQIELMRWAFRIPQKLLFNARSEENHADCFLEGIIRERRCIVPADTIFEWQDVKKGKKPKYEFVFPGREPFGMAAIWKLRKNPKIDKWERTFGVLTGAPNELMQPIHPRMTTFLEPRYYAEYLAPAERPPTHLLRILPADEMRATLLERTDISSQQVGLFDSQ
jgi:putative SOS response-associated peptidase YedK